VTRATPPVHTYDIPADTPARAGLPRSGVASGERKRAPAALLVVLAGGLALRLWGVAQGLPYLYNNDEGADFLPRAVHMFRGGLNPHYFTNPPAFTYWLHVVFAAWFGSRTPHAYARDPTNVVIVARVSTALLGTLAIWLLYLVGSRLFGRGVGLLAAALEAVAFLPVFYAHFALNDAPLLVPVTLSLLGSAGIMRRGRWLDFVLAGLGLGFGCATKYTCGVVALPLAVAIVSRPRDARPSMLAGAAVAGVCAIASFLIADPYALLAFSELRYGITHQASASSVPKLGAPGGSGFVYYLWSLSWGLGWVPMVAALGGVLAVWMRDRRAWWLLVPPSLIFLVFMNIYVRHFGRWLLPIFPIISLLAAFGGRELIRYAGRRGRRWELGAAAVVAAALCGQGLVYSVHSDVVLSRPYTAALTRAWMVAHIPAGARVLVEPVVPANWVQSLPHDPSAPPEAPWRKYSSLRSVITASGALDPAASYVVNIEDYERTLSPALIPWYEHEGVCWVVSGSTQAGRAYADPRAAPNAIAYYAALQRSAQLVYRVTPLTGGRAPGRLSFDWGFDYYPLDYRLPGPEVRIYRLGGPSCGGSGHSVK
jgi:4-amino-4-deoxy-L-arabinose transferase-like glycosyltransferase